MKGIYWLKGFEFLKSTKSNSERVSIKDDCIQMIFKNFVLRTTSEPHNLKCYSIENQQSSCYVVGSLCMGKT